MAGIQDAIGNYRKNLAGGLASPQLSPELLKALKIPKGADKSVFERLIGGYDKASKQNAENLQGLGFQRFDGALGSNEAETPQGAILSTLGEGILNIPSAFAQVYSPVKSLLEAPFIAGGDYLSDKSVKEKGRQSLGQDILRQLSAQDRMQQGQLPRKESSTMGQGSGEYLDTRGQDETGIEAAIGDENTGEYLNQEEIKQKIIENTQLGDMSQEGADIPVATAEDKKPVLSAAELLAKKQKDAFTNLISSVSAETGMDTTKDGGKPKSIEDYKLDFQKATGIDVSGEPDNKMALMSLGLSLMQNKAGKGFDLSKILGSVGEAGQAAMPAFERARQEAKQGQLAAGKFALQQTKADKDAIKSANTERAKYLRGRRDVILDRIAETATDQQKAYTKFKFDEAIEFLKAGKKSNKYNQIKTRKLIQGNDVLKVDIGYQGTTPMYANPTDNVRAIVGERKKIYRSLGRIDKLSGIITDMYNDSKGNIGGTAGQIVFDKTIGALSALGITDADAWFKTNGVSRNSQAETILRLLVQENKRFILKESGNGVSNLDKKDLEDAFGKIVWTNNLQENLNNLRQIKSLFDAPLSTLDSTLDGFITEKDKYQSTDLYNDTVSIINDGLKDSIQIKPGSGNNARRINVSDK